MVYFKDLSEFPLGEEIQKSIKSQQGYEALIKAAEMIARHKGICRCLRSFKMHGHEDVWSEPFFDKDCGCGLFELFQALRLAQETRTMLKGGRHSVPLAGNSGCDQAKEEVNQSVLEEKPVD